MSAKVAGPADAVAGGGPPVQPGRLSALVGRPAFWVLFLVIGFSVPIARQLKKEPVPELPKYGTLPAFSLTDQHGNPFGSRELTGKVWVANFIFTRCPTICPLVTQKMQRIQKRSRNLGEAFHLVSFSVDPEYDKPEVLAEYARKHRASPRMWRFLTGAYDAIKGTVTDGFKISMGREGKDVTDPGAVFHGTHFVLVDRDLVVRGYYDLDDEAKMDTLLRDAGLLANGIR